MIFTHPETQAPQQEDYRISPKHHAKPHHQNPASESLSRDNNISRTQVAVHDNDLDELGDTK